ncbi:hypothetical protein ThidrDRAFT_3868 [Thiorhodococcus drewsii AZ1]|uniref:Uncharacterized protein n=1 Tax=Thiorhodococcus drewsii AZ1 TaxID=765913 RepID=G2E6D5_9GAMM|nr:hypothetical protein ThidrDRAFT_3868 [Thiorhodococcus drewsii AZ1]
MQPLGRYAEVTEYYPRKNTFLQLHSRDTRRRRTLSQGPKLPNPGAAQRNPEQRQTNRYTPTTRTPRIALSLHPGYDKRRHDRPRAVVETGTAA